MKNRYLKPIWFFLCCPLFVYIWGFEIFKICVSTLPDSFAVVFSGAHGKDFPGDAQINYYGLDMYRNLLILFSTCLLLSFLLWLFQFLVIAFAWKKLIQGRPNIKSTLRVYFVTGGQLAALSILSALFLGVAIGIIG